MLRTGRDRVRSDRALCPDRAFQRDDFTLGLGQVAGDVGPQHRAQRNEEEEHAGGVGESGIVLLLLQRVLAATRGLQVSALPFRLL